MQCYKLEEKLHKTNKKLDDNRSIKSTTYLR